MQQCLKAKTVLGEAGCHVRKEQAYGDPVNSYLLHVLPELIDI